MYNIFIVYIYIFTSLFTYIYTHTYIYILKTSAVRRCFLQCPQESTSVGVSF